MSVEMRFAEVSLYYKNWYEGRSLVLNVNGTERG